MATSTPVDINKDSLIKSLIDAECLRFGDFTLKSGIKSDHYIDLRMITENSKTFKMFKEALVSTVNHIKRPEENLEVALVGVPYGVWPLAGACASELDIPFHPVRKESKGYGNTDVIDFKNRRYIVIEDTMSTGTSIVTAMKHLPPNTVTDIVVIVDREVGGPEMIVKEHPNVKLHTILKLSDIMAVAKSNKSES